MLKRIREWLQGRPGTDASDSPPEQDAQPCDGGTTVMDDLPPTILEEVERAKSFKWFAAIGDDIDDPDVDRIRSWDAWEGPEQERVAAIHIGHSEMQGRVTGGDAKLDAIFIAVRDRMIDHLSRFAPFDPNEDAWHGPTTAVVQAAWTVALVALHKHLHTHVPEVLAAQYRWYKRGHWPCGYKTVDEFGRPAGFCIF